MQFLIDLPLSVRLTALAVFGAIGGAFANHVISSWCWFPRPVSPWLNEDEQRLLKATTTRRHRWLARLPVVGWLTRTSERDELGRWFWLRPMSVEVALIVALPAYYWFTCIDGGQLPISERVPARLAMALTPLHWMFAVHAVLLVLMTAATFIDFDEQTIPDLITIPGTLFALAIATLTPWVFMPAVVLAGNGAPMTLLHPITFWMSDMAPDPKWYSVRGLLTGLAIWTVWCFALANRRVILRKGWKKAVEFFWAGLVRYPSWKILAVMWVVGVPAILAVWSLGGDRWTGLFTALVGLAVGGGIVWAVRIVASAAMGVEAMGFGDVTLMAMIGAFIGWQASLSAFFLSPLAAIAIVIIQYIITRESRVPFGPYLCAGTVLTAIWWDRIYNQELASVLLLLAPMLLWFGLAMFGLLGGMLFVWSIIKRTIFA